MMGLASALGLTSQEAIGFTIVIAVIVLFLGGLAFVTRRGFRRDTRPRPDIPPAMQPAPTDAELEKPRLEKLQGWALASIVFLAVWIPIVWLQEPTQNKDQTATLTQESIARGAKMVQLFSENNILGVGCVRCHGPNIAGGHNLFNNAIISTPDLQTVCAGPNATPPHPLIHNIVDVKNTIMQGRPGTDMPSWSVRYAGALDDQQIQDLVDYIVSLDEQHVPFKDNVCINPKAAGYVQPVVAAQ